MKNYILLSIVIFAAMVIKAQRPHIDSIYTIPWNPLITDNIKIVTRTSTTQLGERVNYSLSRVKDTFKIKGCFWNGFFMAVKHFNDTTYIGNLLIGTYKIKYKSRLTNSDSVCTNEDSFYKEVSFRVRLNNNNNNALNQLSESRLIIYPNPASGIFNMSFPDNTGNFMVEIYNTLGVLVHQQLISGNQNEIDLSNEGSGLYIVKVMDKNGLIATKKITKQ